MRSTHKRRRWVRGEALETLLALRRPLPPGDEVLCSMSWLNETKHLGIEGYRRIAFVVEKDDGIAIRGAFVRDAPGCRLGRHGWGILPASITAWRPPKPTKKEKA